MFNQLEKLENTLKRNELELLGVTLGDNPGDPDILARELRASIIRFLTDPDSMRDVDLSF